MIYKYYPDNDFSLDALTNQYLWFSRRELLNDKKDLCFEFIKGTWFYNNIRANYFENDQSEEYVDKLAVCCFTHRHDNKKMWKEYASDGHGFVLMLDDNLFYRFNDSNLGICFTYAKGNYFKTNTCFDNPKYIATSLSANRAVCKDFTFQLDDIITQKSETQYIDDIFKYVFTIKQSDYDFEEENRLLIGLDVYRNHSANIVAGKGGFKVNRPLGLLKGIILGEHCSSKCFNVLKAYSSLNEIPLYQYKPAKKAELILII